MIRCPSCGREIADNASKCPHCGHSFFATNVNAGCLTALLVGGGFLLLIMIVASIGRS